MKPSKSRFTDRTVDSIRAFFHGWGTNIGWIDPPRQVRRRRAGAESAAAALVGDIQRLGSDFASARRMWLENLFQPDPRRSPERSLLDPNGYTLAQGAPLRPKRVLFFGKSRARSSCTGAMVEALREAGLEVRWLNCSFLRRYLGRFGMRALVRLISHRFDPDLCFVFYHDLPQELMSQLSKQIPTVVWMEEQARVDRRHLEYVRDVRLLCLSTPRLVREYREQGVHNSTFMLSGFSPSFHRPVRRPHGGGYDRDVAFIGAPGHMGDRPEFLAWLAQTQDLEIFGRAKPWLPYLRRFPQLRFGRELRPRDYAEVCARSKVVLGLNQDHSSGYYFSNRLFLTLACRGFHLIHYVPGTENIFERGEHLDWFHSRNECLDRLNYYLADDEERERIAEAGYQEALAAHQYSRRVQDILGILAGEVDLFCPSEPDSLRPHSAPMPSPRVSTSLGEPVDQGSSSVPGPSELGVPRGS